MIQKKTLESFVIDKWWCAQEQEQEIQKWWGVSYLGHIWISSYPLPNYSWIAHVFPVNDGFMKLKTSIYRYIWSKTKLFSHFSLFNFSSTFGNRQGRRAAKMPRSSTTISSSTKYWVWQGSWANIVWFCEILAYLHRWAIKKVSNEAFSGC